MKDDWYCKTMGIEFGPMSFDDLAGLAERGNLRPGDAVRRSQAGEWIKAAEVPGLVQPSPRPGPPSEPTPASGSTPASALHSIADEVLSGEAATARAPGDGSAETRPTSGAHSLALGPYNCAILIGPGGVALCDLRDCQEVVVAGARVVGHRSAGDETPIRFGPLELQVSVREVGEWSNPLPHAANMPTGPNEPDPEAVAASAAGEPAGGSASTKRVGASKGVPREGSAAETGDIAAEMLRRMFMPRSSNTR